MKVYYNKKIVDDIYINSENIHKTTNKIVEDINNNNDGFYAKKEKLNNLLRKLNNQSSTLRNYIVDVKNVYDRLEIEDEILDKDNIKKYDPLTYFDNYVKSIDCCLQTNQLFENNNSKISSLTNMLFLLFEINNYKEEYNLYLELKEFIRNNKRIDYYFKENKDKKYKLLNELLSTQEFKDYYEDDIYEGDYIYGSLLLHDNIDEIDNLIRDIHTNLGEQTLIFSNISTNNKILSKDPHYINLVINTREYISNNTLYIVDSFPKNLKGEKRYNIDYPFVNNEEFIKTFDIKRIKDGIIKLSTKEDITSNHLKLLNLLGLTIYVGKNTDTDVVIEVKEVNPVDLFEQSINNIYSKLLIDVNKNKDIGREIIKVKEIFGGRKMENKEEEKIEETKTTLEDTEFDLEPIKINVEKEEKTEEPVLPEPPEAIAPTVPEEVPAKTEEIPEETKEIDPVAEAMKTPLETEEIPQVSDEALKTALETPTNESIPVGDPIPVDPTKEEIASVDIPPVVETPIIDENGNTVENYSNPEVNNEAVAAKVDEQLKAVDNISGEPKSKAPLLIIICTVVALILIIAGILLYNKFFNKDNTPKDVYELKVKADITTSINEEFFDNNSSCEVYKNGTLDEAETAKITYEGIVNAAEEGEYFVTCRYVDPTEGLEKKATRKITVEYPENGDVPVVGEVHFKYNTEEVSKDINNPTEIKKYGVVNFFADGLFQGVLGEVQLLDKDDNVLKKVNVKPYEVVMIDLDEATKIVLNGDTRYIKVTE